MKYKISKDLNGKKLPKEIEIELEESDCAVAFGLSLRRLRKAKGLSLNQLSELIDIPNPTINRYESGYNLPSIFMALKIVRFFETQIEIMIFAGVFEQIDKKQGIETEKYQYIEQFSAINNKLNDFFNTNTKLTFNDHKKKANKANKT